MGQANHVFLERDGTMTYEVTIALTADQPIAPALAYRAEFLKAHPESLLSNKISWAKEGEKLFGAIHAYLWGDGRTASTLKKLSQLGVDRAALFYDQDPREKTTQVGAETISAANQLGYIIGPYDTLNSIEPPATANSYTSIYDEELYRTGGIQDENGQRHKGFAGYGLELSSEALRNKSMVSSWDRKAQWPGAFLR